MGGDAVGITTHAHFLFQLLQNFFHRPVQLRIVSFQPVFKGIFHIDIRGYAGEFQVLAVQGVAAPARDTVKGAVYQALAGGEDDPAVGFRSDHRAQLQGFETGGGHFGVTQGRLVDQENDGLTGRGKITLGESLPPRYCHFR